jgi:diguanylate cyclase (GGDEF)-like protein/PAS domain S-box-containing protein
MNRRKRVDLLFICGFSFLILLIISISILWAAGLEKTKSLFSQIYQNSFQAWVQTEQANADLLAAQSAMKDVVLSKSDDQFIAAFKSFNAYDYKIWTYFDSIKKMQTGDVLLRDLINAYDDWTPIRARAINYASHGQYDLAAENTRTTGSDQVKLISSLMQQLIAQKKSEADAAYRQSENTSVIAKRFLIWMTAFVAVLAVMMSLYIRNRLLKYQSLLHEEKETLRITLDSIGDGVITTDTHRNILSLNKIAENFTGWAMSDALGKSFNQVFSITNANTGEPAKDPVEEVLKTDSVCLLENHTVLTSKDGIRRHIADSAAPIKDENGRTFGVVIIFRDVTARKAAEQLLKESEEKFRTIFEQSPIGIGLRDSKTGQIISVNGRFADIIGLTAEELCKSDWRSITHPDDINQESEQMALLDNRKIPSYHLEKRYIKPDGSCAWINSSVTLLSKADTENPQHLCMIEDITQQKIAEIALAQSLIKLEATLQSTADGILAVALNGNIIFYNLQYQQMLGLPSDFAASGNIEVASKFIRGCLVNPELSFANAYMNKPITESAQYDELELKDGRTLERYSIPIRQDGVIMGHVLNFRDISERKRAEQALSDSEAKHKAMIANISDSIIIIDKHVKLKYMSPNLEKMFGWSQEDFADKQLHNFIHPDDMKAVRHSYLKLAKKDGMKSTLEFRMKCKDERYEFIQLTAVNMISDTNIEGILMNFHDISDRKKRETEILYLNYHDLLTGLYNRAFFEEECARLDTPRQLPISVIMGDINGLKLVNDAFGHKEGDKLLIEIARILAVSCRKEDILARTGGDEFCILLPQTTTDEVRAICKRIYTDCVSYESNTDKGIFQLSISLGYATKIDSTVTIESILTQAEEYMYKQKLLERKSMRSSLISSIKSTMNEKSHLTAEHEERLVALSKLIGRALDLPDAQINELELLSTLHDIGKLSINDQILNKPGKLTNEEWTEIKKHPDIGYRIAQASPELVPIADFILCHHERWDGTGYPQGLKGRSIPLLSRIVSVVDAYDAMTQDRSYRKAMPEADAINEIKRNAGTQFDPEIAGIFVNLLESI